jgi:hypothetical protein
MNVSDINSTYASSGGEIIYTGNSSILARGLCWNTTGDPTISDNHTIDGEGTNSWIRELKDIEPDTKYYVRAYATNSQGTAYGSQISFITLPFTSICEAVDNCDLSFALKGNAKWFSQANYNYYNGTSLQSGTISHLQESIIETEVTGPGYLSFWWKISSEKNSDNFEFYLNNTIITNISGDIDWQIREFDIPEGKHTLKWRYRKNGASSVGHDCGWLDKIVFTTAEPTLPTLLTENITDIKFDFAKSGGEITSSGFSSITARGICWNTTGNPTVTDNKTTDGKGT